MPGMDGFAVIDRLRQDPQSLHVPGIVLTAKTLAAAELAQIEQRVRKVIQKRGLNRDPLIQEPRDLLRAYRSPAAQS